MKLTFLLLLSIPVFAQVPATLDLTIYDSSGIPIPGARITVGYSVSAISAGFISDQNGRLTVHLASGSYRITVESARAIPLSQIVNVNAGQVIELALRLAQTPVPDPPSRPVIQSLRQAELEPGQPGGFIEGAPPYGVRGNQGFDAAGQRSQQNNFLVDGMDNNDIWARTPALLFPSDSIGEVTLSTGLIPAEFGHATGAIVSIATPAGTNQFHGALYEYFQNSRLNSRNFFDAFNKPGDVSNQFGLSVGGRAHRGIYFFFNGEGLRDRQELTVVSTVPTALEKTGLFNTPVYDPATLSTADGVVYSRQPFAGNQIPWNRISPAAQAVLALYPNPNLPGVANNFLYLPTAANYNHEYLARTDVTLTSRNTAFIRFNTDNPYQLSPSAFPTSGSDYAQGAGDENMHTSSWSVAVSDAYVVAANIRNEFRAAVSSVNLNAVANDQGVNASALLGVPGLTSNGIPSIQPTGYTALGAYGPAPLQIHTVSEQIEDDVAWTTRHHAFHFGFQAIHRDADGNAGAWTNRGTFLFTPDFTSQPGTATGNSIASLLLGYPDEVRSDAQLREYHIRDWEWSGYVQDQLRLFRRLSIELGIRYQYFPPVSESGNQLVNFNFSRTDPALTQFAGQSGVNDSAGLSATHSGFAPRAGFALDLGTSNVKPTTKILGNAIGKVLSNVLSGPWVLRGGFSTAYDTGAYMFQASLAQNAPYASRYDLINGEFATGSTLAQGLPFPAAIVPTTANLNASATPIYAIQRGAYTPYSEQWNLFIEHRILSRFMFQIGGIGSRGVHLYQTSNANQPEPGPYPFSAPREPYSPYDWRIDYLGFGGESTYYAGVTKLTGTFWRGIVLQLNYAYSKSIDDSAAPATNPLGQSDQPQISYDPRASRSLSAFNVPQRAVLLAQYQVPAQEQFLGNWRINLNVTLQSGLPFTPQLATSTLNDGGYQLPDRIGNGALSSGRSYQQWFDTALTGPNAAFAIPALYQFGNSGTNILSGPSLTTVDLALGRTFVFGRRLKLDFRVDAYNILNRANFALPNRILGVDDAGLIDHTITPARRFQLSLRVQW
jgi:hypothetical protein